MHAKSTATIANILNAAQKLFVSKSYTDVTMADIAKAAQVTKGALYHHFSGKEDLYQAVIVADFNEKRAIMQAAVQSEGTCRERLHALTLNFLKLPPNKRAMMSLIRRDINIFKDPVRGRLVRAYQTALPEQVQAIIHDGIYNGELVDTDPRLLAWQYVAMVEVILSQYAKNLLTDHNQMANYVLNLFFYGAGNHKTS